MITMAMVMFVMLAVMMVAAVEVVVVVAGKEGSRSGEVERGAGWWLLVYHH